MEEEEKEEKEEEEEEEGYTDLAPSKGIGLGLLCSRVPGSLSSLTHVGSEGDQVEVFVDVVHDLGLEENLSSVVHDLIAELGLGNILSQLLDTSSTSLWRSIFVDHLNQ